MVKFSNEDNFSNDPDTLQLMVQLCYVLIDVLTASEIDSILFKSKLTDDAVLCSALIYLL